MKRTDWKKNPVHNAPIIGHTVKGAELPYPRFEKARGEQGDRKTVRVGDAHRNDIPVSPRHVATYHMKSI